MTYLVGIDEAGYGPRFGPLVMASVSFKVPAGNPDLWKVLSSSVSKTRSSGRKIVVCDSKRLYSPSRGTDGLASTASAFFSVSRYGVPARLSEYLSVLGASSCEDLSVYPWYCGMSSKEAPVFCNTASAALLSENLSVKRVSFEGAFAEYADAGRFNAAMAGMNKSDFLFAMLASLLAKTFKSMPDGCKIVVKAGKHGGKNFYASGIMEHLKAVKAVAVRESGAESTYRVFAFGRDFTLSFLRDGEDADFGIALASVYAKHTRELFMKELNGYWTGIVPGLKPTAGYPADAPRFLREITPRLAEYKIPTDLIYRLR